MLPERELVEAAFELYEGEYGEKEVEKFLNVLRKALQDVNVISLIKAAEYLDTLNLVDDDPAYLVADELIGIQIAEYIGGKNALFNFFRYDTHKPGILAKLPPFQDDAYGGLIAGCMTRAFQW
jgi:alpha-ribazole phosphatase CobZ